MLVPGLKDRDFLLEKDGEGFGFLWGLYILTLYTMQ